MKISFITTGAIIYFIGLAFYVFKDDGNAFWNQYFYILGTYLVLWALSINFVSNKTITERSVIAFMWCFKALALVYFLISTFIVHNTTWLNSTIGFWVIMGLSGLLGLIFAKHEKK